MRCGAVRCGVVWFGLEFSQNHNRTAPHFCDYMRGAAYKMRLEAGIFFKFWIFPTQPKIDFFPLFLAKF